MLAVTLLFAAMLGVSRLFVAEREEGGLDGFAAAPSTARRCSSPGLRLFCFLAAIDLVPPSCCCCSVHARRRRFAPGSPCIVLVDIGIAVIGTLVGAIAVQTRARDLLVRCWACRC